MKDEDSYGDVSTQYVYSSIKNQKTKTEKNTEAEFDASYNFGFYLKQDKNLLINILFRCRKQLLGEHYCTT